MTPPPRQPALIDPGWLFLVSGLAVLGATILIPAQDDLDYARWLRDRALAVEAHREERITRYEEYLAALDSREPSLVLSLAASQLNQIPEGRATVPGKPHDPLADASVFPGLEPAPVRLPERTKVDSLLARLTTGERTRLWAVAAGAACVLLGLLPQSRGWAHPARRHPYINT